MGETDAITVVHALAPVAAQNEDAQLVALWLHGRSLHTARVYARDANRFRTFVGRPLPDVRLGDVQAYADTLAHLASATQARILSAVESLSPSGIGSAICRMMSVAPCASPPLNSRSPNGSSPSPSCIACSHSKRSHAIMCS